MNATATAYNPLTAALAELTSPRAKAFYALRAQRDIQTTIDAALTVYCAAAAVAQFLVDFYATYNASAIPEVSETFGVIEDEVLMIAPPSKPIALLCPAADDIDNESDDYTFPPSFMTSLFCTPVDQAKANEQAILEAIQPSVAALQLIKSIEKTDAMGQPAPKAKRGRKPSQATQKGKGGRKPKALATA